MLNYLKDKVLLDLGNRREYLAVLIGGLLAYPLPAMAEPVSAPATDKPRPSQEQRLDLSASAGPATRITLTESLPRPAPLRLLVFREYAPLIEAATCDWRFIEAVAQVQQRDIELFYRSAEEAVALTLAGQVDGIYYASAALGHQIPSLLVAQDSELRDPMAAYLKAGGHELPTFGSLKGRKITYLPGFLGFDRLVAGGFFDPKSIAAESIPEMIAFVAGGDVDAMFVITRFQPLVEHFALALKGVTLRVIPTPQVASLFIYLSPQHPETLEPLNRAFRQVIFDQQLKEHNLDPFNCPDA